MKLYCLMSVLSAFSFCNKTKWFLVCILWSCFFCCLVLIFVLGVSAVTSSVPNFGGGLKNELFC